MSDLWWEIFGVRPVWIEITRRPSEDIGFALNHYKRSHRAYELLSHPEKNDMVLHWYSKRQQFVGVSKVAKPAIEWKGSRVVILKDFQGLPKSSLTLEKIRPFGKKIGLIRDSIAQKGVSTHFPFQPYGPAGWDLPRPALAYLTAAPSELISLLGAIYKSSLQNNSAAPTWADLELGETAHITSRKSQKFKDERFKRYLTANEELILTDSGKILPPDRSSLQAAHRQHNALQNRLAKWLKGKGLQPESQRAMDKYPIDIQWRSGSTLYVAEVKSLNSLNESSQIRRGIGQVLHYRFLAARQHQELDVVAALILPREPGTEWVELCEEVGIVLAWPNQFGRLLH